eukprot:scaffold12664_cov107-Isochrysis_galbana.AAC.3
MYPCIRILGPVGGYSQSDRIADTGYRCILVCADTMAVRISPETRCPLPLPFLWSRPSLYHTRPPDGQLGLSTKGLKRTMPDPYESGLRIVLWNA